MQAAISRFADESWAARAGHAALERRAAQYVVDHDLERPRLEHFQRGGQHHAYHRQREAPQMRPRAAQHHADEPERAHQAASSSTWARRAERSHRVRGGGLERGGQAAQVQHGERRRAYSRDRGRGDRADAGEAGREHHHDDCRRDRRDSPSGGHGAP